MKIFRPHPRTTESDPRGTPSAGLNKPPGDTEAHSSVQTASLELQPILQPNCPWGLYFQRPLQSGWTLRTRRGTPSRRRWYCVLATALHCWEAQSQCGAPGKLLTPQETVPSGQTRSLACPETRYVSAGAGHSLLDTVHISQACETDG